jgi:hypothetical protein
MLHVISPPVQGAIAVLTAISLAVSAKESLREETLLGKAENLGGGTVQSFVKLNSRGAPLALGVTLSANALKQLPSAPNTTSRCFDLDNDGQYSGHECMGDEERILELPATASIQLPFRWIMLNWNPAGHHGTPYTQSHFDFHFYMEDRRSVESIRSGRCGEMVDCEDFKRGSEPVPAQYLPADYIDVGAVAPRMGNHLLDSESPELKDSLPFTSTFIFGAYQGKVTFWEPMITHSFLLSTREACLPIRQPQAFGRAGYYPSRYCVRQDREGQRTVSLEGFRYAAAL